MCCAHKSVTDTVCRNDRGIFTRHSIRLVGLDIYERCSHYDLDQREYMSQADRPLPYQPRGALDGIVCNTALARRMGLSARWGSSCGMPFHAKEFFERNIQWKQQAPYVIDRPHQPWTVFTCAKRDQMKTDKLRKSKGKGTRRSKA